MVRSRTQENRPLDHLKAGITDNPMDYPWSSYHEYLSDKGLCETSYILGLFSEDRSKAKKQF